MACTETYARRFRGHEQGGKGLGAQWEGFVITQELFDVGAKNTKFIPILFSRDDARFIPRPLRGATYYQVCEDDGYDDLYRRLTRQPRITKFPLGSRRDLDPDNTPQRNAGLVKTRKSEQIGLNAPPAPKKGNVEIMPFEVSRFVNDLIESLPKDRMGVSAFIKDDERFFEWTDNLLEMLRDIYSTRQSDAYTQWLRPNGDQKKLLEIFQQKNMPAEYKPYRFAIGEGLAGKVWQKGEPAASSKLRQHPWWVMRPGCLTESYICVPVGDSAGLGGVLAVGSFAGFETDDRDIDTVKIFATLLSYVNLPKDLRQA